MHTNACTSLDFQAVLSEPLHSHRSCTDNVESNNINKNIIDSVQLGWFYSLLKTIQVSLKDQGISFSPKQIIKAK